MDKKILKCSFKDHWNHFDIIELAIDDIWQSVPSVDSLPGSAIPFKKNLISDIQKNGMHFPIMVVHTSHEKLLEANQEFQEALFKQNQLKRDQK